MKLPKYMYMQTSLRDGGLIATLKIKNWGIPIIVFKAFKKREGVKWYHWIFYPKICAEMMAKR